MISTDEKSMEKMEFHHEKNREEQAWNGRGGN